MDKKVFQKPYLWWMIGIFLIYISLNIWLSEFYVTIKYLTIFSDTIHWQELVAAIVFTIIIGILIAINSVLSYLHYEEKRRMQKQDLSSTKTAAVWTSAGTVGGLTTGVCTSCAGTVLPNILSIFGVTLSFAALPFKGLEIQVLIITLLTINLYIINKKMKTE